MTSQAQVRRLLSLVPYLREHKGAKMADVATAFGITTTTLRADLNVLWMCGMPGLTPGDEVEVDPPQAEDERQPQQQLDADQRRQLLAGGHAAHHADDRLAEDDDREQAEALDELGDGQPW